VKDLPLGVAAANVRSRLRQVDPVFWDAPFHVRNVQYNHPVPTPNVGGTATMFAEIVQAR